ncbi:unnamed protein product [Linum trigynum]|uniref:Secreted protein n=1 Tax=Linum trigynum TaxID=586398 RepID=A0AAV2GRE4_9ROSI
MWLRNLKSLGVSTPLPACTSSPEALCLPSPTHELRGKHPLSAVWRNGSDGRLGEQQLPEFGWSVGRGKKLRLG